MSSLPLRLTLFSAIHVTDGGTTTLYGYDELGRTHSLFLIRRTFAAGEAGLEVVPGRLYFNGREIAKRSDEERQILMLLRAAAIATDAAASGAAEPVPPAALILGADLEKYFTSTVSESLAALRDEVVRLVESEDYLASAESRVGEGTLYDAWVIWKGRDRKRTIGRLANAFEMGVRMARTLIDEDRPILRQARAPVVSTLRSKLRELGLGLRTSPEYRWIEN
jgi:hypothetical protein